MTETTLHPFELELIARIEDEKNYFNMRTFTSGGIFDTHAATCDTASCMGGHIEALRHERAVQLMSELGEDHGQVAMTIYEEETGKRCRLDFYANNYPSGWPDRDEAVEHIKGISLRWPQLGDEQYQDQYEVLDETRGADE